MSRSRAEIETEREKLESLKTSSSGTAIQGYFLYSIAMSLLDLCEGDL